MKLANADEKVAFFHDGYAGEALEEKKRSRRNLRLLEQELAEHPQDREVMGYLGDEYLGYGEQEQALLWYRRSVEHMPSSLPANDPRSAWTFSALISLYASDGNLEEAKEIYDLAVRLQPKDADFDYEMGRRCVAAGRFEDGLRYLSQALTRLERYGSSNRSMRLSADLTGTYGNLALCFLQTGRRQEAVQTAVAVLKTTPYREGVAGFLGKLYRFSSLKDRLFIARAAREAGWESFARQMEKERG